jgi:hypothetical protein
MLRALSRIIGLILTAVLSLFTVYYFEGALCMYFDFDPSTGHIYLAVMANFILMYPIVKILTNDFYTMDEKKRDPGSGNIFEIREANNEKIYYHKSKNKGIFTYHWSIPSKFLITHRFKSYDHDASEEVLREILQNIDKHINALIKAKKLVEEELNKSIQKSLFD